MISDALHKKIVGNLNLLLTRPEVSMTKAQWNFYIDILMSLCMAAIAGIGFLMKYVLLPGKEAWAVYGKKVDLSWLGLDRHAWGAIHFYVASLLLGLLLLHIILHWQMIVSLWQRYLPAGRARLWATVAFLLICGAFFLLPFFLQPTVTAADSSAPGASHRQVRPEMRLAAADHRAAPAALPSNGKI